MANERITVHHGADGNDRDTCWLKLDDKHLWGGFRRDSLAQDCADRLNAAFDEPRADARLAWTTKPTKPGWYIFKEPPTPCGTVSHGAVVEVVWNGAGDGCLYGNGFTCGIKDGFYLGPLPEIEDGDGDE